MFRNYLKIAMRNLRKNRAFSVINIVGLAVGIAAFLLILEYVSFERSYNQFHQKLPNLYRVLITDKEGQSIESVMPGIAPVVKPELGEITNYCRVAVGVGGALSRRATAVLRYGRFGRIISCWPMAVSSTCFRFR